jgi:hypothetical protein
MRALVTVGRGSESIDQAGKQSKNDDELRMSLARGGHRPRYRATARSESEPCPRRTWQSARCSSLDLAKFVPLVPHCPAWSRVRFFLGKGGTGKCGIRRLRRAQSSRAECGISEHGDAGRGKRIVSRKGREGREGRRGKGGRGEPGFPTVTDNNG